MASGWGARGIVCVGRLWRRVDPRRRLGCRGLRGREQRMAVRRMCSRGALCSHGKGKADVLWIPRYEGRADVFIRRSRDETTGRDLSSTGRGGGEEGAKGLGCGVDVRPPDPGTKITREIRRETIAVSCCERRPRRRRHWGETLRNSACAPGDGFERREVYHGTVEVVVEVVIVLVVVVVVAVMETISPQGGRETPRRYLRTALRGRYRSVYWSAGWEWWWWPLPWMFVREVCRWPWRIQGIFGRSL